jgi:hypothetical protein
MAKLLWGQVGDRRYEAGLDRGVLYLSNGTAIPWNGLTAISENAGVPTAPLYFDGIKYLDDMGQEDYSASLTAFTYPPEFLACEGVGTAGVGLYVDDQNPSLFDLSYRTKIGNDISDALGYKIHLVYNLTAEPDDRSYTTLSADVDAMDMAWNLTAVPELVTNYRPTAHAIIDTAKLNKYLLPEIEDILYGSATTAPRMPSLEELTTMMANWNLIAITDHGDGTWTATGPDEFVYLTDSTSFQIDNANATYSDADTFTISSTYD